MDGFRKPKQDSNILHINIKKKRKKIKASSKVLLSINQVSSDTSMSPDEINKFKTIINNLYTKSKKSKSKNMKQKQKIVETIDPKMRDAHFLHKNHLCSICDIDDEKYSQNAKNPPNFEKSYPNGKVLKVLPNNISLNLSLIKAKEKSNQVEEKTQDIKKKTKKDRKSLLAVEDEIQDSVKDSDKSSSLYASTPKKHKKNKSNENTEQQNFLGKGADNALNIFVDTSDTNNTRNKIRESILTKGNRIENTINDPEAFLILANNLITERERFSDKDFSNSTYLNYVDLEYNENNTNRSNLLIKNKKKKEKSSDKLIEVVYKNQHFDMDSDLYISTTTKRKKKKSIENTELKNSFEKDDNSTLNISVGVSDMSKNKKKKRKILLPDEDEVQNTINDTEAILTLANHSIAERNIFIKDNMEDKNQDSIKDYDEKSTISVTTAKKHKKKKSSKKTEQPNPFEKDDDNTINDPEEILTLANNSITEREILMSNRIFSNSLNLDQSESTKNERFVIKDKEDLLVKGLCSPTLYRTTKKKKKKHSNETFLGNKIKENLTEVILDTATCSSNSFNSQHKESSLDNAISRKKKKERLKDTSENGIEDFIKKKLIEDKNTVTKKKKKKGNHSEHFVEKHDKKKKAKRENDPEKNILKRLGLSHSSGSENENFIFGSNNKLNKLPNNKYVEDTHVENESETNQSKEDLSKKHREREEGKKSNDSLVMENIDLDKKETETEEHGGMVSDREKKKYLKEYKNPSNSTVLNSLTHNHLSMQNITNNNQAKQGLPKRHKESEGKRKITECVGIENTALNREETKKRSGNGETSGTTTNLLFNNKKKYDLKQYKDLEDTTAINSLNDNNLKNNLDSPVGNKNLSNSVETTDVTETPSTKQLSYAEVNLDVLSSMQKKVLSCLDDKKPKKKVIANYTSDDSEIIIPEKKRKFKINVNKLVQSKSNQVKLNNNNDNLQCVKEENGSEGQSTLDNFLVPKSEDYHILRNSIKDANAKEGQQSTLDKYLVSKSRDVQNDEDMRLSIEDVKKSVTSTKPNSPERKIHVISNEILSPQQSRRWFKSISSSHFIPDKSQINDTTDLPTHQEQVNDSKDNLQSSKIEIEENHLDYTSDMELSEKEGLIPKDLFSKFADSDDGFIDDSKENLDLSNKYIGEAKTHQAIDQKKKLSVLHVYGSDTSDTDLSDSEKHPVKKVKQEKSTKKSVQGTKTLFLNKSADVEFDVPLLHKLFPQNSALTADVKQKIKNLKIPMKSGKFSSAEDKQIKANWYDFAEKYQIENSPKEFYYLNPSVVTKTEKQVFLYHLGRNLNDRNLGSVFKRFKILFHEDKSGRFSKEEDTVILKMMKKYGTERGYVVKIANKLERPKLSVEKRIRLLTQGKPRKIKWKKRNLTAFIASLLNVTQSENVNDLKNRPISKEEWDMLSKALDNMPLSVLRNGWYLHIHPRLFLNSDYIDLIEVKKKLILLFYENKERDWKLIDWKKYVSYFDGLTTLKLFHVFHDIVKIRVPVEDRKNLRKTVKMLKQCLEKGDFQWTKYLTKINFIDGEATEVIIDKKLKKLP